MKASAIDYLIDAGPLIALLDRSDQWHSWSVETLTLLDEPLATTETAVAEACHHLRRHRAALAELMIMVGERRVCLCSILADNAPRVAALLAQYPRMDVGDATLVVLSECHPRARLITTDRADFIVYRRRDGRPVPCIMPPVSH